MHRLCFPPPGQYPLSASFVNSIPSFLWEIEMFSHTFRSLGSHRADLSPLPIVSWARDSRLDLQRIPIPPTLRQ